MTDGQETSATESRSKGPAASNSAGHKLAEKRKENQRRKKMAHRRTIARSNTTG